MKYLRLELKVCESCGVLWLRRDVETNVYCTSCATRLANFPPVAQKRPGGRPRTSTRTRARSSHRRTDGAR
jgi:hypothetical protein